jgi:hypothetical protein
VPGHSRIVRVAYGHKTTRLADPAHLAKGRHRVCEVLHQLMGMNDIEGGVGKRQLVDVPDQQPKIQRATVRG